MYVRTPLADKYDIQQSHRQIIGIEEQLHPIPGMQETLQQIPVISFTPYNPCIQIIQLVYSHQSESLV